jgi:hypothetical protein
MKDSRYPYTYADDFVRSLAGYNEHGTKLSRADVSQIVSKLALIWGIDITKAFNMLADYYLSNQDEIDNKSMLDFQIAFKSIHVKE